MYSRRAYVGCKISSKKQNARSLASPLGAKRGRLFRQPLFAKTHSTTKGQVKKRPGLFVLFNGRCLLLCWIEWRGHEFLDGLLGVVIIVAQAFGPFVGGNGARPIAFAVVGVAHLDV